MLNLIPDLMSDLKLDFLLLIYLLYISYFDLFSYSELLSDESLSVNFAPFTHLITT